MTTIAIPFQSTSTRSSTATVALSSTSTFPQDALKPSRQPWPTSPLRLRRTASRLLSGDSSTFRTRCRRISSTGTRSSRSMWFNPRGLASPWMDRSSRCVRCRLSGHGWALTSVLCRTVGEVGLPRRLRPPRGTRPQHCDLHGWLGETAALLPALDRGDG